MSQVMQFAFGTLRFGVPLFLKRSVMFINPFEKCLHSFERMGQLIDAWLA